MSQIFREPIEHLQAHRKKSACCLNSSLAVSGGRPKQCATIRFVLMLPTSLFRNFNATSMPPDVEWHLRLVRLCKSGIDTLAKSGQILLNETSSLSDCTSCTIGKTARISFGGSGLTASRIGEIVVSYVIGPLETSVCSYIYFVTFVDVHSRSAKVHTLRKSLGECISALQRILAGTSDYLHRRRSKGAVLQSGKKQGGRIRWHSGGGLHLWRCHYCQCACSILQLARGPPKVSKSME